MQWQPAHKTHAIERVGLTLQFAEAITSKSWQSLLNSATLQMPKNGLNTTIENREFQFPPVQVGGLVNLQLPFGMQGEQAPSVIGRTFQSSDSTGIREQATFNKTSFGYQTSIYDGWDLLRSRFDVIFGASINNILNFTNFSLIKLEYWDRFTLEKGASVAYSELLNEKSIYIANSPLDQDDLWHSHVGFFSPSKEGNRRLININVDALDLATQQNEKESGPTLQSLRSVGIYTMIQESLSIDNALVDKEAVISTLDELHTILKSALSDVITSEAAARIALNP